MEERAKETGEKVKLKFGDKVTIIASDSRWLYKRQVITGFEDGKVNTRDENDMGYWWFPRDLRLGWGKPATNKLKTQGKRKRK